MMNHAAEILVATAAAALLAALGAIIAQWVGSRRWTLWLVAIEMVVGITGSIVLAILIWPRGDAPSSVTVVLWNWFRIKAPQSLAVSIGLEATALKSGLVAVVGLCALLFLRKSRAAKTPSDDCIPCTGALYVAVIAFVLSPSLPQSLLGWAAISLFTAILFRISKTDSNESIGQRNTEPNRPSSPARFNRGGESHAIRVLVAVIQGLAWMSVTVRELLTKSFPDWVLQEAERIERGTVSIQLLAATLGTSAILLTWLLLSFHSGGTF